MDHRGLRALFGDRPAQVSVGVGPQRDVEPPPIPAGFEVIRRRWVVERTFAWISGNRRMSRDYEFLAQTTEALIYVTMIRLMLRRLAQGAT
jgi:putative transposase